tara:strand:- start:75 stop:293 length:219 start_codon:yes stop_codon:yes gene_type:complete
MHREPVEVSVHRYLKTQRQASLWHNNVGQVPSLPVIMPPFLISKKSIIDLGVDECEMGAFGATIWCLKYLFL